MSHSNRSGNHPPRPTEGWLNAARRSAGLSLKTVAGRLNVSPQAVHQFERSEVAGTLSLRQLENVAGAIGYRVTYALVGSPIGTQEVVGYPAQRPAMNRPRLPSKSNSPHPAPIPPPSVSLDRFSITSD